MFSHGDREDSSFRWHGAMQFDTRAHVNTLLPGVTSWYATTFKTVWSRSTC